MVLPFDSSLRFLEYGYPKPKDSPPSLFLQSTAFAHISELNQTQVEVVIRVLERGLRQQERRSTWVEMLINAVLAALSFLVGVCLAPRIRGQCRVENGAPCEEPEPHSVIGQD